MVRRSLLGLAAVAAVLGLGTASQAQQIRINEIYANPPGGDNGFEFFELRSTAPSFSMSGLTLLILEGDGAGAGTIDQAFALGAFSTGTNGLFMWRDAAGALVPGADPATTINVADFAPDIENGTQTYLLVSGFSGTVGTDLDVANDGALDATPWTSVLDGIGVRESGGTPAADVVYAGGLGFADFPFVTFTGDLLFRASDNNAWYSVDTLGTTPGPFPFDPLNLSDITGAVPAGTFVPNTATPGFTNPVLTAVPEPTTLALLGLVAGGFGARQWSKRRRVQAGA